MPDTTLNAGSSQLVSLATEPGVREWRDHPAYSPDAVQSLVRRALVGWGLGQRVPAAPLADLIPTGARVLLKPNWVVHANAGPGGTDCLVTHPVFLLAALREVLAARPGSVVIGDAPIQSCDFSRLVTASLQDRIEELGREFGVPVMIVDFRRTIMARRGVVATVTADMRELRDYVRFDLGGDSLLEALGAPPGAFRVGDYDPRELARTHGPGHHEYLLCREAFAADVVISLPKLKTHCKAGLTGALKNLVGLNGNKDYLPHYRAGGSGRGGDNYEGWSVGRQTAERFEDIANGRLNRADYPIWKTLSRILRFASGGAARMGGGWHGNDTVWRMVLDLNRVLLYGRPDGTIGDHPQRVFYSLTDAVMCGQGDGPLRPEPCLVGAVTFGASALACDLVHAALLRLDAERIPLLRQAAGSYRWPLAPACSPPRVVVNGAPSTLPALARVFGVDAEPPAGWRSRVEWDEVRQPATP